MTAPKSRTINHVRSILFDQLDKLTDMTAEINFDRVRAVNDTAKLILESAKIEVAHAAVVKGAVMLPFIEDQEGAAERPYRALPTPAAPPAQEPDTRTPEERALDSGPAEDHPWRKPAEGNPWTGLRPRAVKSTH